MFLLGLQTANAETDTEQRKFRLCGSIAVLTSDAENITFTDMEKKLVCGDPKVAGWKQIPRSQAVFFMKNFLQSRGYHNPTFNYHGEHGLDVVSGAPTYISAIVIEGTDEDLAIHRYWEHLGNPLTPDRLTAIENWVSFQLKRRSYPCPQVSSQADVTSGRVVVRVEAGEKMRIVAIKSEDTPGIVQGILRRYDAFKIGDAYDPMTLEITENRMIREELVMNTRFNTACEPQGAVVEQTIFAGEPRLVAFGVGFDTEQFLVGKFSWQNTRLGRTGSSFEFRSIASYLQQEAFAAAKLYYLPMPSRHYLAASSSLRRENERRFETNTSRTMVAPAITTDQGDMYVGAQLGPVYQYTQTMRGEAPEVSRVTSLNLMVWANTHEYEYYRLSPREGYKVAFNFSNSDTSLWSDFSGQTYELLFHQLWNPLKFDPPLWVFALRTSVATTALAKSVEIDDTPPNYRYYLGGSSDLRGFGRKALPPNDQGALTKAYAGVEARLMSSLPYKLQPLIFFDLGAIGDEEFRVDRNRFMSPGTGLRWESPFGAFEGTLAQGIVRGPQREELSYLSRWQFYFSFGDTF